MKFRVFDTKVNKEIKGALVDCDGNIYLEGICGLERVKGARIDLFVGFDENKNPIYENDPLILKCFDNNKCEEEAFAIFDGDRVWLSIKGGLTPFKQAIQKIYLKETK